MIPDDLTIRILRMDDGSLFVQRLHPEGPLLRFFGEELTPIQVGQVATALLFGSGLFPDKFPEEVRRPEDEPGFGFVYLLTDGALHKIGRSRDPESRARAIGEGLRRKVALLHTIRCDDAPRAERTLQDRFAEQAVHGEWFNLSSDQVQSVRGILEYRQGSFIGNTGNQP